MGAGFHSVGNHLPMKHSRKADDALENGQVIEVLTHVASKDLVDLYHLSRQALEIGER
jgi:hypothetical protein